MKKTAPTTQLCTYDDKNIYVRGKDVCALMGSVSFTQAIFLDIFGRFPTQTEVKIIDAVFVNLIEHGLSPSAIATRMVYSSAPESIQGAVAAGLQAVGGVLVGTLELTSTLLNEIVNSSENHDVVAERIVERHRQARMKVPGFGHPHFYPDDPRTLRLFEIARAEKVPGKHIEACLTLSRAVDKVYGKHITMNASAGMAAVMCEIGIPPRIMRGFAVICRAAGLVAHVFEEQDNPTAWTIMDAAHEAVPYAGETPKKK